MKRTWAATGSASTAARNSSTTRAAWAAQSASAALGPPDSGAVSAQVRGRSRAT
ncbi:hypothetical protein ACFVT9_29030 [Kitasatospora cineracea]|uniref:hypothetical protein n=1 Tax=Kitasatospora cineracea TaxID=88074 RepID=UPI0036DCC824